MSVRIRITMMFSLLVLTILAMVCSGIYFFSHRTRLNNIKTRLTNRAITTARLLSQHETFNSNLVLRIDSSTTISLNDKIVQAYDKTNERIYLYSEKPSDSLNIDARQLAQVREKGSSFFQISGKEAIGYHYVAPNADITIFTAATDAEGKKSLDQLETILIFGFLTGNILVVISGYFFSKGLLLPLKKMSADVQDISAQNLTRRIEPGKSRDEWHQMATTFNSLLDRLQESFEMQRRFLANASHEISTPLTAISNQLEVSLSRQRDASSYRLVMESIFQDVQQLCKLTQTLLEFAKASGDPGGLEIRLVRVDEIILRLPAEALSINPIYNVKIDFEDLPEQEEFLLVFGNEPLLLTAIKNIVLNACKYSPNHAASVVLRTDATQQIHVLIYDNGPGIMADELEKIFHPFYRINNSQPGTGFGLGLSLALRIIKLHKGSIEVQSHPGDGTTFQISLPAATSLRKG